MTATEAVANAVRLLQQAEGETDRSLMEHLEAMAATWVAIAGILSEVEAR